MKRIKIPKEQKPSDYLVVRLSLVHVKKLLIIRNEKEISASAAIQEKPEYSVDLYNRLAKIMRDSGVVVWEEDGS